MIDARRCGALLALLATLGAMPAVSGAESAISTAEQKVFLDDHLRGVGQSGVLRYRFKRIGTLEKEFDDSVSLTVRSKGAQTRRVEVAYLTGERKITLPAVDDAKANPVILYFLEQDVRDMHRRLGGSESYFRRRIRLAFAEGADVHPTSAVVDGRKVDASEVVIHPFADDPMKQKLGPYEAKSYVFVLSEQVPGGVVRLQSRVAGDAKGGGPVGAGTPPLVEDVLSFDPAAP